MKELTLNEHEMKTVLYALAVAYMRDYRRGQRAAKKPETPRGPRPSEIAMTLADLEVVQNKIRAALVVKS